MVEVNSKHLMGVVDRINLSGLGSVFFAAQGTTPQWSMKREHLSSACTARWKDLPRVWRTDVYSN
ncbi:DUF4113 domain-containing protein [Marinomonas algicola]|uniref:DUF4113 domain-containing protein n=1 Tax=Marinomonas algicola TaxID=2773454 RepID=UPI003B846D4A